LLRNQSHPLMHCRSATSTCHWFRIYSQRVGLYEYNKNYQATPDDGLGRQGGRELLNSPFGRNFFTLLDSNPMNCALIFLPRFSADIVWMWLFVVCGLWLYSESDSKCMRRRKLLTPHSGFAPIHTVRVGSRQANLRCHCICGENKPAIYSFFAILTIVIVLPFNSPSIDCASFYRYR
jgi:hypothetical protein